VEGAIRLLSTLRCQPEWSIKLGTVLLEALKTELRRDNQCALGLEGSGEWTYDAFKLRGAEALEYLLQEDMPGLRQQILSALLKLHESPGAAASTMMWMTHPSLRYIMQESQVKKMITKMLRQSGCRSSIDPVRVPILRRSQSDLVPTPRSQPRAVPGAPEPGVSMGPHQEEVDWKVVQLIVAHPSVEVLEQHLTHVAKMQLNIPTEIVEAQTDDFAQHVTRWCALAKSLMPYAEDPACAQRLVELDYVRMFIVWMQGNWAYKSYPCELLVRLLECHEDLVPVMRRYLDPMGLSSMSAGDVKERIRYLAPLTRKW